jgi:hypothetical protein
VHTLSNGRLRLVIDAERGGTITEFIGGATGDQWFLNEPERQRAWPKGHPVYDDVWSGGFEELFPNDAPGEFGGRTLPDHGELWNGAFEVADATPTAIRFRRACTTVPATIEKAIELDAQGVAATISYRLSSLGDAPLWFLFKLHAAMRVEAGDGVLLPGGTVTTVEPGFGALASKGPWPWPVSQVALDVVRDKRERFKEFVYVSGLPAGWCGIRRSRTGESLRIEYPRDMFPHCWLFITYGGWRDYNTVVLEPCTNVPKELAAAKANGTCAVLAAGEVREFSVRISVRAAHES